MADFPSTATIRQRPQPAEPDDLEDKDIELVQDQPTIDEPAVVIHLSDGSVEIEIGGAAKNSQPIADTDFDANLAEHLSESELAVLAEELLQGIEEDDSSRKEWLEDRAQAMKWLALKIESPTSDSGSSSAGLTNQSRTRHPLLLEAVLRGQANARGEFLPTDGPVKIDETMAGDTVEGDELAQLLEDDFNYFLTETATEYYPDTDRMFFWVYWGGMGLKKVYRCPIRRRPCSESIDAEDVIISNQATDIMNADRVTIRVKLSQSQMKRMQKIGAYRDVTLEQPSLILPDPVKEEKQGVTGIAQSQRTEDAPYELYESYAMIDVPGDEHKEKGEITGIPRPYQVTLDRNSHQCLAIYRNWKKDDPLEMRRRVLVDYPMIPAIGFWALGLMHIMGNSTVAATALQRIMIDAGTFGNFPGGLIAKGAAHQNTMDVNVSPGSFAPIDVSMTKDGSVRDAAMPLPYKEAGPGIFNLFKEITQTGARVGGAADIAVGEGRQDAPVGTTLALLDQATKVIDAVHKRLHTSQATEIKLLRDLFIEYPEDFWKFNRDRDPNWDAEKLTAALKNYNLVPRSDPNTSSKTQRMLIAQALYMMANQHPELFQAQKVLAFVLRTMGINDPESLTQTPPPQQGPPDIKGQAALLTAQSDQIDAQTKAKKLNFDMKNAANDQRMNQLDNATKLKIAGDKLQSEALVHGSQLRADDQAQTRELVANQVEQARDHAHEKSMGVAQAMQKQPGEALEKSQ